MSSTKTPTNARPETPTETRTPTVTPGSSPPAAAQATQTATPNQEILKAVNRYRATLAHADLAWDDRLAAFAQDRAQDMITRGYFSHSDPQTGKRFLDQLGSKQANGETLYQLNGNIAARLPMLAELVLAEWKNSPAHAAIIGDPRMTRAGVGVATTARQAIVVLVVEQ